MQSPLRLVSQPKVDLCEIGAAPCVHATAAGDPLREAAALDLAAQAALGRIAAVLSGWPLREQVAPRWALGLARLGDLGGTVTMGRFGDVCLLESNVSYIAQRLAERGLIAIGSAAEDRRLSLVRLTEHGRGWLERLRAELGQ